MTLQKEDLLQWDEVEKCDTAFHPILAAQILNRTLEEITKNKKERDEAQKNRLELAIKILKSKVVLPAFPDKTRDVLIQQMEKQLKKVTKKKKNKDKKDN